LDATRDFYYFDPATGVPLNLGELNGLLAGGMPRPERIERPFVVEIGPAVAARADLAVREGENAFSAVPDALHLLEGMSYFRIIPRNNFLSQPRPIPVAQGFTKWGWDGYINHYNAMFPKRREYQRQSDRLEDFYEPLNQAAVTLSETDRPGRLRVQIDTFTPGFETFLVRVNESVWREQAGPTRDWDLAPGLNHLAVRVRTQRAILGPISYLEVSYHP
jgi:hypothetical protein